jgi:Zn-dependent peptidase ImmA (M78 family)
MHYEADKVFVDNNSFKLMFRKQNFSQAEVRREREANSFAAAILMPRNLIKVEFENLQQNLSRHLNDEQIIHELAATFEVSELAMAYRLSNLGYVNYR